MFLAVFAVALAGAEALPRERIENLLKAGEAKEALVLVDAWRKSPPEGLGAEEAALLEGRVLLAVGRTAEAAAVLGRLAEELEEHPSPLAAEANAWLGCARWKAADWDGAQAAWRNGAEVRLALKKQGLCKAGRPVYFTNRIDLDGLEDELSAVLAKTAEEEGEGDGWLRASLLRLNQTVDFAGMRSLVAKAAVCRLAAGRDGEAAALCLRALSTGEDRCFQRKARLPENQRQLVSNCITLCAFAGVNRHLRISVKIAGDRPLISPQFATALFPPRKCANIYTIRH